MSRVIGYPKFRVEYQDANGFTRPAAGYRLHTFQSGTSRPQVTYSDSALTSQNTNPIILDSNGECWLFPSLTGIYTFALYTDTGTLVWSKDGIGADASSTGYGTLRLNLADAFNVANGDAMIGVMQPLAGAVARTQHEKNAESITVTDFTGCDPTGATDSTTAFNAASVSANGKRLRIPAGNYLLTATWDATGVVDIIGDGAKVTKINFEPTADDTCLYIYNGVDQVVLATIKGLNFHSSNTTHAKVAIDVWDTSSLVIDDIYVSGTGVGVPNAPYWTGGSGSIGIQTHGREAASFSNLRLIADYPIYIRANPNWPASGLEDVDHWHFYNMYLHPLGQYAITVQDGLGMSHATFDGYQAWVGGKGGIKMNDTRVAAPGLLPSRNITIKNVRTEQSQFPNEWGVYLKSATGIQQLRIENCLFGFGSKGIYLGRPDRAVLSNVTTATAGVALLVEDAIYTSMVDIQQCAFDPSGTVTLTDMRPSSIRSNAPLSSGISDATWTFDHGIRQMCGPLVLGRGCIVEYASGTAETTLFSCTIPGGLMGKHGQIRVRTQWYTSNNANAKTVRIKHGSLAAAAGAGLYLDTSLTNRLTTINETLFGNTGTASGQTGSPPGGLTAGSGWGESVFGPVGGAIDTSVDQVLYITGQKAVSGDLLGLVAYTVELIPS